MWGRWILRRAGRPARSPLLLVLRVRRVRREPNSPLPPAALVGVAILAAVGDVQGRRSGEELGLGLAAQTGVPTLCPLARGNRNKISTLRMERGE